MPPIDLLGFQQNFYISSYLYNRIIKVVYKNLILDFLYPGVAASILLLLIVWNLLTSPDWEMLGVIGVIVKIIKSSISSPLLIMKRNSMFFLECPHIWNSYFQNLVKIILNFTRPCLVCILISTIILAHIKKITLSTLN